MVAAAAKEDSGVDVSGNRAAGQAAGSCAAAAAPNGTIVSFWYLSAKMMKLSRDRTVPPNKMWGESRDGY